MTTANTTIFEEALDSWIDAREGVIAEAENIPARRFNFRPALEVRSVAELLVHIIEVSMMMTGELTRADTNFARMPFPKLILHYSADVQPLRSKKELMPALRRTLREGLKAFREVGEIHMLQTIRRFDGLPGTRLAWFHHGVAQEMYHRGQLALYQRLMGIKPALTARIERAG